MQGSSRDKTWAKDMKMRKHRGTVPGKSVPLLFFSVVQRFIYDAKYFWIFLGSLGLIYPSRAQGSVKIGSLLRNIRRNIRCHVSYACHCAPTE